MSESSNAAESIISGIRVTKVNKRALPVANRDATTPHSAHDRMKRKLEAKAENLKPVSFINGKPVFVIPSTTVINFKSGFGHKLLCDFVTFTTGSACVFRCAFCYVLTMLRKNKWIIRILKETGLKFSEIVVRRQTPAELLRKKLAPRGKPKFTDPKDTVGWWRGQEHRGAILLGKAAIKSPATKASGCQSQFYPPLSSSSCAPTDSI